MGFSVVSTEGALDFAALQAALLGTTEFLATCDRAA